MKSFVLSVIMVLMHFTASATDFVPVFIYHRVDASLPASDTVIAPTVIESQIKLLVENGYTFVTIDTVGKFMDGKRKLPRKVVAITFDDGWKDNTIAVSILDKYKVPGTFFVLSGAFANNAYLTREELKTIARSPVHEIGVHTHTHLMEWWPNLDGVDDRMLVGEVLLSKGIIEKEIGREVTSFAWPFGYTRPHLLAILQSSGLHNVTNVDPSIKSNTYPGNRLSINRINVHGLCTAQDILAMADSGQYIQCNKKGP